MSLTRAGPSCEETNSVTSNDGLMIMQKPEEQHRVKQLEKRVQELESALAQTTLDKLMLESLLEVVEEEEGIALKKNIERWPLIGRKRKVKQKGQT